MRADPEIDTYLQIQLFQFDASYAIYQKLKEMRFLPEMLAPTRFPWRRETQGRGSTTLPGPGAAGSRSAQASRASQNPPEGEREY